EQEPVSDRGQRTVVGASVFFGGHFGGRAADAPAPYGPGRTARFGDPGTVFFSEESGVGYASTSYSGASRATTALTIAPGFDAFIRRNVSLGLAGVYSKIEDQGFTPSGYASGATLETLGALARFGVAVPLAERVSLYPRASLGYTVTAQSLEGLVRDDGK